MSVATNSVILFFELFNPKLSKSKSGFVFRESSTKCYVFWIHCYGKYQIIFHSLLGEKLIVSLFCQENQIYNFFFLSSFYYQVNLITPQVKNVLHSNFTILFVTWSWFHSPTCLILLCNLFDLWFGMNVHNHFLFKKNHATQDFFMIL